MSRIIVKNLPEKCREDELRKLFSSHGEITDLKIVKTKRGTSRKFCFVGFKRAEDANASIKFFNKTYIGSSKIEVEEAKPYGDSTIARPWSKYSADSSHKQKQQVEKCAVTKSVERKNLLEEYETLENDEQFQEFLDVSKQKSKVKTWSDSANVSVKKNRSVPVSNDQSSEEEGESESMKSESEEGESKEEEDLPDNAARSTGTSDMDYLRTKMIKEDHMTSHDNYHDKRNERLHVKNSSSANRTKSSIDSEASSESEADGEDISDECEEEESPSSQATTSFTVKMLGLPFNATVKDVAEFFHPLTVAAVRFTKDDQGRASGRGYADFHSENDLREALSRNKDCIRHRYIELFRDDVLLGKKDRMEIGDGKLKPWEVKASVTGQTEVESILESGRIFIRNLPYCTEEEDLEELFGKYGPLTESAIPLDKTTNKPMGVAFITFMLPEHAAKAFHELDGQIFQGRLLHLLPAKPKTAPPTTMTVVHQKSSYKQKKDVKNKQEAGRGHNWNSLFLGTNAVLDVMAEKYDTDKSIILDTEVGGASAAVRMALGETEVVRETREFLLERGVVLEAFQEVSPKRSKTTILVKNLPSGTKEAEISKLFQAFGQLSCVILPPAGVTALVEFAEPSHARLSFSKLAYTSFKHLPLYLEWAPVNALQKLQDNPAIKQDGTQQQEEEGEDDATTGTVFVKNLNFSTCENDLAQMFSALGEIKSVTIAEKRNMKDLSSPLSMGYGFVEFKEEEMAAEAVKTLQNAQLDGHSLQLKISKDRTKSKPAGKRSKHGGKKNPKSSKILVRNVPFEASRREIQELFCTFGALKTVRLPKKLLGSVDGSGEHRGFGFVEFVSKEDAAKAFDSLSLSTHLYGRRLVLEWAEQEESLDAIRKRTAEHFHVSDDGERKRRKRLALDLEKE